MARALESIFRKENPRVLELGPFCGDTVVQLAERGARVWVDVFEPPEQPTDPEQPAPELRINHPDESFDLVLAWEWMDFLPVERLTEFSAELRRLLVVGGWLLLFSLNGPAGDKGGLDRPGCYRMLAEDRLRREPGNGDKRHRWVYPTRKIEGVLAPLKIQTLHLQRNQMREFLALKGH